MTARAFDLLRSAAALVGVGLLMLAQHLQQQLPATTWRSPVDLALVTLVGLLGLVFVGGAAAARLRARTAGAVLRRLEALLPGTRRRERDGAALLDARRDGAFVRVTSWPGDRSLSCRVAHRLPAALAGRLGRIDGDLLFVPAGETGLRAPPSAYASPAAAAAVDALLALGPSIRVSHADLEAWVPADRPDDVVAALDRLIALARALAPPLELRVQASTAPRLTCPYCHGALEAGERVDCAACGTPHHAECFHEHGRCTALGCESERPTRSRVR